ncbi:hypothetical protein [Rhodanobacter koreensis]
MTDILIGRNDSTSVGLDPHYGDRRGKIETIGKQVAHTTGSQPGGMFGGKR